jgi:uncharacterized membrane protein YhiD involved in acid resistance
MFDQFFRDSGYYEFPSFEVAIFSLLLAFVLSSAIAFTYRLTYKGKDFPNHLFQAIVLSSLVTSMIMMAIDNNFAVGFGIIGAVAIIRFRTLISDPRNIIFMFAGISIGIATGVYGYSIAISGTVIFCIVAFLLYYSPYGKPSDDDYELVVEYSETDFKGEIDKLIEPFCRSFNLEVQRKTELALRRRYNLKLKKNTNSEEMFQKLKGVEGILTVRIEKNEVRLRL